jgi:hypothetical protein
MLYQVLTLKVGTDELNEEASRALSAQSTLGFYVYNHSFLINKNGDAVAHYLMKRVPDLPESSEEKEIVKGNT